MTLQRASQSVYARPNVPSGSFESFSRSRVYVLIRGRCLRMRLPSGVSSIWSRSQGREGPAVVSPRAATISVGFQKKKCW